MLLSQSCGAAPRGRGPKPRPVVTASSTTMAFSGSSAAEHRGRCLRRERAGRAVAGRRGSATPAGGARDARRVRSASASQRGAACRRCDAGQRGEARSPSASAGSACRDRRRTRPARLAPTSTSLPAVLQQRAAPARPRRAGAATRTRPAPRSQARVVEFGRAAGSRSWRRCARPAPGASSRTAAPPSSSVARAPAGAAPRPRPRRRRRGTVARRRRAARSRRRRRPVPRRCRPAGSAWRSGPAPSRAAGDRQRAVGGDVRAESREVLTQCDIGPRDAFDVGASAAHRAAM